MYCLYQSCFKPFATINKLNYRCKKPWENILHLQINFQMYRLKIITKHAQSALEFIIQNFTLNKKSSEVLKQQQKTN